MRKAFIGIASVLVISVLVLVINYFIFQMTTTEISRGKPIVQKDSIRQALLVIDIQEGLTGKSSTDDVFIEKAEELISVVNQITDASTGRNIPVIYVKNEISNPLINVLNNSMAKGSSGAELDSRLHVVSQYVINKDKGDAFSNALLDSILLRHDINTLVFVGLDLAQCVKSTISAAVNRNYRICLISDALVTNPDSLKNGILENFKQSGCQILTGNEYLLTLRSK